MMTDADIERTLRGWFAEGDEPAPWANVAAALSEIATTKQRRGAPERFLRKRSMPSRQRWTVAFAVIVLAALGSTVAVSFGAALLRSLTPPEPRPAIVEPTRSPTPTSSPAPSTREVATATPTTPQQRIEWPEGGVGVRLSEGWAKSAVEADDMVLTGFGQEVRIFRGDDQGWVVPCLEPAGAWERCDPIRPTTLDGLAAAVRPGPELEHGQAPVIGLPLDFNVGGESGYVIGVQAYEYPDRGSEWVNYIVAINEGRPYVIRMWTREESGIVGLNDLIDGFRFLPTAASNDLLSFDWPELGIGLAVPQAWLPEVRLANGTLRLGRLQPLGAGGMLDISVGGPDGTIRLCTPNCSEYAGQTSIDELELTLRGASVDGGPATPVRLGGVDARSFRSVWKVLQYRVSTRVTVFAIHDGRPVVLSFAVGAGNGAPVNTIVETFRFLAPPESNAGAVAWTEGGVSLNGVDGWRVKSSDDTRIRLERASQVLSIARGDDNGRIQPCTRPAGPFERCDAIQPSSLDDALDKIGLYGEPRTPVVLDGEPAILVSIEAQEPPARGGQWVGYVVATHDGRVYVIRLHVTLGTGNNSLRDVIDGFRFEH